jgi:alpha-glucosidase
METGGWSSLLDSVAALANVDRRSALILLLIGLLSASFAALLYRTRSAQRAEDKKKMARDPFLLVSALLALCAVGLGLGLDHRDGVVPVRRSDSAPTQTVSSHSPQFTVPGDADTGAKLIANIADPDAIDPQTVCPGYQASAVRNITNGFEADLELAGEACNVYGTDVEHLRLVVEYLAGDRLHIEILPQYIGAENNTWFVLPEELVPKPAAEDGTKADGYNCALEFTWENEPSFSFTVTRKSSEDVLFTTRGTKLVFEDQFFEVKSSLPTNYNLYGLGEVIHGFRLGNNLTSMLPYLTKEVCFSCF